MPHKNGYIPNEYVLQTIVKPVSARANTFVPNDLDVFITNLLETHGFEVRTILVHQAKKSSYSNGVFPAPNHIKKNPNNEHHYS